jgi:hypothetical protein
MQHMVESAPHGAAARDCKSSACDLPTNTALQQPAAGRVWGRRRPAALIYPAGTRVGPQARTAWRAAWWEEAGRRFSCAGSPSSLLLSVRSGARGCEAAAWLVACFIIARTRR